MQPPTKQHKTVFVGLSGGVDSAVAAARLIDAGYDVVGVFIKVWHPEWMVCNWERERLDAMRVAAQLGIPFLTCDAEAAYRDEVAAYFIAEYKAGRTPNPDVLCNQYVKFGAFLDFASAKGADYIATGHYAQRVDGEVGGDGGGSVAAAPQLHRGVDTNKDQTYFLWSLSSEQLQRALFPVGNTPKALIRAEAEQRGLPVFAKKDSQGICFLGHVDIAAFLSHYVDVNAGVVLDTSGVTIGSHRGALVYTIGQRHGFAVTNQTDQQQALYVVARDLAANTITVAPTLEDIVTRDALVLQQVVLRSPLRVGDTVEYQIRYRQTPQTGVVSALSDGCIEITPATDAPRPAPGQSCVLYQGAHCVGGGILT